VIYTNGYQKSKRRDLNTKLKVEAYGTTSQGNRKTMEDQITVISHLNLLLGTESKKEVAYFGVYDGHLGKLAAEYARTHLHLNIYHNSF